MVRHVSSLDPAGTGPTAAFKLAVATEVAALPVYSHIAHCNYGPTPSYTPSPETIIRAQGRRSSHSHAHCQAVSAVCDTLGSVDDAEEDAEGLGACLAQVGLGLGLGLGLGFGFGLGLGIGLGFGLGLGIGLG